MMRSQRITAKDNIRKIWLFGFALMIFWGGSNAFALDLLGPPTTELEKGMFRGGLEYAFSNIDLELKEGKASVFRNGELLVSGNAGSVTINDFEVNTLYATVGYGVFENCEAFVRLGAAKAEFGDSLWEEGEDFDSGIDFAIGAGVKATFYEGFDWKVGGIIQINRSELDGEIDSSSWVIPQPHFAEIGLTEIQIAMGASYMYSRRLSIYGGPFAHFISGDFEYKFSRITTEFDTGEYDWEINEGPTFGGYLGAQIEISKSWFANIEYQHSSDANVLGASIMMRY